MPSGLIDRAAMPSDNPLKVVSSAQSKPSGCCGKVSSASGEAPSSKLDFRGSVVTGGLAANAD